MAELQVRCNNLFVIIKRAAHQHAKWFQLTLTSHATAKSCCKIQLVYNAPRVSAATREVKLATHAVKSCSPLLKF